MVDARRDNESPSTHTYFSQRLRLQYLDWGNESAPHLLLIHGIRDHCRSWDRVAEELRDDFHIVAPDLRGHGNSEWTKGSSYSYLEYTCDIEQLVRQQKLDNVVIIAHSMGGTIASIFAGIYPECVSKLVLIEGIGLYPAFFNDDPSQRLKRWISTNRALAGRLPKKYDSIEDAYHRMQYVNPHLSPDLARHLTVHGSNQNEDGTYSWKFDNFTHSGTVYEIPHEDIISLWERIDCPVLIINSGNGYPHRIGHGNTLSHFQEVQLINIPNAGHWAHHDEKDHVINRVNEFLSSN